MLNHRRHETAADVAADALFDAIMDGTIRPGTPLRLQDLARRLDMSMTPVREAIRRLEALGLVEIEAHRGAWVRPLSREDLYDTYSTRIYLEALAIRLAADRFTAEDAAGAAAALEELHAAHRERTNVASRAAHERFHFTLYNASGSPWLIRSIRPAWRNSERYRVEFMRHPEFTERRHTEHLRLLSALSSHNAEEAVDCLVAHLRTTVDVVANELPDSALQAQELPQTPEVRNLLRRTTFSDGA